MKPVVMFIMESCPYCKQALKWMEEIREENPVYSDMKIQIIDETKEPEIAESYDYYYVPTYYVDGKKVHEGAADKDIITKVFEKASL